LADKKALKILFDTYWSSAGWKKENITSPEDFTYAQNAGVMFQPVSLSHDEVVNWLTSSYTAVNLENIRNAFLVSLSTRQLELRSALGSFAVASNFPAHTYHGDKYCCTICGGFKHSKRSFDLSRFSFERYKWGGVRHERPEYAAFDLEQFSKLDPVVPAGQDLDLMREIIEIIRQSKPETRPRDLEKKLLVVLKSNKAEREILLEILAYCGILQPKKHSGYYQSFPHYFDRVIPPVNKIDWTYPICWWRGQDGVNKDALEYYFQQLI
jgi:hypothetical protein